MKEDTICAVSTAPGVGGIAVVRMSGPEALTIVSKCWRGADLHSMASHTAHLGKFVDVSADGESVLDEVVLTVFKAPHSFTGEDVVEIACHGSVWIQQQIVNILIAAGCRAATGGEFTRRAYTNGRMDLSQAEAVADVIASTSRASHRVALNQMRGAFSRKLKALRLQLLDFVSLMELELDFSEEDVEFADRSRMLDLANEIKHTVNSLADSFAAGSVIKNGLPVAIVGETNAGKSTLLNYLLKDDRALVSDIHGTTRDVIEDTMTIGGALFRFIDTAGIRETQDTIETMGIERTFKKIDEAQLILWVMDCASGDKEIGELWTRIAKHIEGKQLLAVVNKVDKISSEQRGRVTDLLCGMLRKEDKITFVSAKNGDGLDDLQNRLTQYAAVPDNDANAVIVTNARHYEALLHAGEAIGRAIAGLESNLSGDFVSQDIRETMHYLGEITGEITTDQILGTIFSRFCIGK